MLFKCKQNTGKIFKPEPLLSFHYVHTVSLMSRFHNRNLSFVAWITLRLTDGDNEKMSQF